MNSSTQDVQSRTAQQSFEEVANRAVESASERLALDVRNPLHQIRTGTQDHAHLGDNPSKSIIEFASTLGASVSGTVWWALASRNRSALPVRFLGSLVASGSTRAGLQGGLEHLILPEEQRSTLTSDFAWGTVDGIAGIVGGAADSAATRRALGRIGRSYLGPVSNDIAETAGRKAVEGSITSQYRLNGTRGMAGGAAGSLAWSLPHELYNHRNELDTLEGWKNTARSVTFNTAFGAVTGGALAEAFTTARNAKDIGGYLVAGVTGNKGTSSFDILHFNDMHSALLGTNGSLPQLATKVAELRAASAARGRSSLLFDAGDNYSGNVAAGYTNVGYVETTAINKMNVDAFVPGNHVADVGQGTVDIHAWVKNTHRIASELNRNLPAVASNIELPAYPGFAGPQGKVYEPYRVLEVQTAKGKERIGVIGLVTKDLADTADNGEITYLNAQEQASRWIQHLNKPQTQGGEGINKVIVLSHLGRTEDVQLATNVKGISYIVGAHSHDAEPVLLWTRNAQTGANVPIMQAGSKARWLAESNLFFKADGSIDRYRTSGRLHRMDSSVAPDPEMKAFVESHVEPVSILEQKRYQTPVLAPFAIDNIRGEQLAQTQLGTLASRAVLQGVNKHLPEVNAARALAGKPPLEPMQIMLKHTGDIREGLDAGRQTHRSLSDVFLNTGGERELKELTAAVLSGDDITKALNFGVSDMPPPIHLNQQGQGTWRSSMTAFKEIVRGPQPEPIHDYSGNFLQTEGLKYSVDMSRPVGARISNVLVQDSSGKYVPLEPSRQYNVLTLFHPIEKWNKNGVFGEGVRAGGKEAARAHAKAEPIPLSQVDLLAEYLESQPQLKPADHMADNISNLTPRRWDPFVSPKLPVITTLGIDSGRQEKQ